MRPARAVHHIHRNTQFLAHGFGLNAGHDVCVAASGKRDDKRDRLFRIGSLGNGTHAEDSKCGQAEACKLLYDAFHLVLPSLYSPGRIAEPVRGDYA